MEVPRQEVAVIKYKETLHTLGMVYHAFENGHRSRDNRWERSRQQRKPGALIIRCPIMELGQKPCFSQV